ncbi:hypothetical protein [Actinotalea fermentans]|uniref:Uncharacterized protein n=1 Tax=Actinotalea fermentans TaxID=43671 RepID=A0A511YZA6_9CELL|nr:hypothetical protein [Actinotalea fermentans]GEN80531.1 hypothetical protein AFE02nite_22650 [Actinotalea fermentans]
MNLELLGQTIVASSDSSSGDPRMFGLLLFASGFVFYGLMYLRYRNSDKHHHHERETEARIVDVRAWDQHVETKKGVKHSKMKGANNDEVRGSISQGGAGIAGMPGIVGNTIRNLTD